MANSREEDYVITIHRLQEQVRERDATIKDLKARVVELEPDDEKTSAQFNAEYLRWNDIVRTQGVLAAGPYPTRQR